MRVFVDTSAFLAILNPTDTNHTVATTAWASLLQPENQRVVTNYVLLETIALAQRRHGIQSVQGFQLSAVPVLSIHWLDAGIHTAGVVALLTANRRQLSLVDCTSFQVMRQLGINTVFAFDQHFAEQRFTCIP
jgi:predicted nucleic acid-binding protein